MPLSELLGGRRRDRLPVAWTLASGNTAQDIDEAEKMLASGLTSESEMGGLKKHPAVNVRNDSVSQLARLGSLLGLDPLSRLRMTSGQKDPDDDGNEFDEFD